MEQTIPGKADIKVSRVCIGGMSFGKVFPDSHQWVIDQPAMQAVLKRALELGVNFIDTANCYVHGSRCVAAGKRTSGLASGPIVYCLVRYVFAGQERLFMSAASAIQARFRMSGMQRYW